MCGWKNKIEQVKRFESAFIGKSSFGHLLRIPLSTPHSMFLLKFLLSPVPTHLTVAHLQSHKPMISSTTLSKFFSDTFKVLFTCQSIRFPKKLKIRRRALNLHLNAIFHFPRLERFLYKYLPSYIHR